MPASVKMKLYQSGEGASWSLSYC